MKRTLLAVALALVAASAFAALPSNDQYRNNAGEPDRHQPQVAQAGGSSGDDAGGRYVNQAPQLG